MLKKIFLILNVLFQPFIYSQENIKGKFALTYDDGPAVLTERFLEVLKENNAKATFFVLGKNVERYPEILKKINLEGHEIGSHTYSHKNFFKEDKKANKEEILKEEILKTEKIIVKNINKKPIFLRMPNGYSKKWAKDIISSMGYKLVNWDFGEDWTKISEEKMIKDYLKALKPGAILLMHDGGGKNREKTLNITKEILKKAKEMNLKPVTLKELFQNKK